MRDSQRDGFMTRRTFFESTARAGLGPVLCSILPSRCIARTRSISPNEKLNVAAVGIGGMGAVDLKNIQSENIIALCDVDENHAGPVFQAYPQARRYKDFRLMLDREKTLDAVMIATPDHLHGPIAWAAIQCGKHVYCQKPLTHTVQESRILVQAAKEAGVATQMGNQGHSSEGIRLVKEWIQDGAIGFVKEVHAWTPLPAGIWPQGMDRPQELTSVPHGMEWDLWLGPAPYRPYHPAYAPFRWRGWWDFGTGALGDQACHTLDVPFFALDLDAPISVEASSSGHNRESFPWASMVHYDFPARGARPPVHVTWYDGGLLPKRPEELEAGRAMGNQYGGVLFVGDKGKLICGTFGEGPRLLPESLMKSYQRPPKTIPRSNGHYLDWIQACKGGSASSAHFDYAGPLTEMALLGNIAIRLGGKLYWDASNLRFESPDEANQYVSKTYRPGWLMG